MKNVLTVAKGLGLMMLVGYAIIGFYVLWNSKTEVTIGEVKIL